jgi:rare lipoprotein A
MKPRIHVTWLSRLHTIFYAIILVIFFLLAGCKTVTKDGPPPYDVDVSKIPNAQPKVEKLSKYGNMPVYRVNGKSYYVMNSSKHYEAEGTASWYGTKFHKRNTSSGEKYDMLSMTAAHRTLPLPTYLEVTNEQNGRSVIVKVNDRGPFADNRLLDLSYAAAKKLGMIGHGTAHVKVKAIDPVQYAKKEIHTDNFYIVNNKNHAEIQPEWAKNNVTPTSDSTSVAENTVDSEPFNNPITPILTEKTHSAFKAKQIQYAKNKTHSTQTKQLASNKSSHNGTQSKQLASNKSSHNGTQSKQLALNKSSYNKMNTQPKKLASNKTLHNKSTVYLQVGAFSNKSYAEKLKKQLTPMVASSIQITQHGSPKKLYRVQIGPIKDSMAVARINKQLKSIGLNGTILLT